MILILTKKIQMYTYLFKNKNTESFPTLQQTMY